MDQPPTHSPVMWFSFALTSTLKRSWLLDRSPICWWRRNNRGPDRTPRRGKLRRWQRQGAVHSVAAGGGGKGGAGVAPSPSYLVQRDVRLDALIPDQLLKLLVPAGWKGWRGWV